MTGDFWFKVVGLVVMFCGFMYIGLGVFARDSAHLSYWYY